jgi:hypothetical protein
MESSLTHRRQEVVTAAVDLDEVASFRSSIMSSSRQAAMSPSFPRVSLAVRVRGGFESTLPTVCLIDVAGSRVQRPTVHPALRASRNCSQLRPKSGTASVVSLCFISDSLLFCKRQSRSCAVAVGPSPSLGSMWLLSSAEWWSGQLLDSAARAFHGAPCSSRD